MIDMLFDVSVAVASGALLVGLVLVGVWIEGLINPESKFLGFLLVVLPILLLLMLIPILGIMLGEL